MAPAVMPSTHAPKWSTVGSATFPGADHSAPFGGAIPLDETAAEEDEQQHIFSAMIQAGQQSSASASGRSSRTSGEAPSSPSNADARRDKRKSPPERLQSKSSGRRHPWALAFSAPASQRSPPPTGPPPAAPGSESLELVDEARTPVASSSKFAKAQDQHHRRLRNFSQPERAAQHNRIASEAENILEPAWDDDQSCVDTSPLLDSDPFRAMQSPRIVPSVGEVDLQRRSAAQLERERDRLRDSMMSPVGSERGDPAEAFEVAALRRQVEQLQMALRQRSADVPTSPSSSSSTAFSPQMQQPLLSKAFLAPYAHLGAGALPPTPTDSRSATSSRHSPQSKGGYAPSLGPHDFDGSMASHLHQQQPQQALSASLHAHRFPARSMAPPQLSPQQMAAWEQLYGVPAPSTLSPYAFGGGAPVGSVHQHMGGLPGSSLPYLASPAPTSAPLPTAHDPGSVTSLQHHLTMMEEASAALYGGQGPSAAHLKSSHSSSPSASVAPSAAPGEQGKLDELTAKIDALERLFRLQAALSPSSDSQAGIDSDSKSTARPVSSVISDGRRASTSFISAPQHLASSHPAQPQHQVHSRLMHASGLPRSPSLSDIRSPESSAAASSGRPRSPAMSAFNFNATTPYGGRSLFPPSAPSIGSSSSSSQQASSSASGALRRKAVARFILGVGSARRPEGGIAMDLHDRDKTSGASRKMKRGPGRGVIRVSTKS